MIEKRIMYIEVYEDLKKIIKDEALKENEKLMTEEELCKSYKVSRITIRRALKELEEEGLIFKIRGKGTFVSPKIIEQNRTELSGFYDEVKKIGKNPHSKIISFNKIICDEYLSKKMNKNENEKIYEIIWIRYIDDDPVIYEKIYLPEKRFLGLEKFISENINLYDILRKNFFFKPTKGKENFLSCPLNKEERRRLNGKNNSLGMKIEKILLEKDDVVEYTLSIVRGDRFRYKTEYNL